MSDFVKIVEVGPRDGLQNESGAISLEDKIQLVEGLARCGFREIETGSFVSPKWVPQMANSDEVFAAIKRKQGTVYSALTPNLKGLEAAIGAKADQVAIFAAASETFSQKNINCSISESIERFRPLIKHAQAHNVPVRGYVSCVLGCPYEGEVTPKTVIETAQQLLELGCFEVSLGDTIGVGTPFSTRRLLAEVSGNLSLDKTAMHFHDTYGQALANTMVSLDAGIRCFDSSVAGLGGCPYAKGASGNLASEDLVYMLQDSGMETGIDMNLLIDTGNRICEALSRTNLSHVAKARTQR